MRNFYLKMQTFLRCKSRIERKDQKIVIKQLMCVIWSIP